MALEWSGWKVRYIGYHISELIWRSNKILFDNKSLFFTILAISRFLDLFGGIVTVSVGHCHPKVNAALEEQVKTLWHTTSIYLQPKIHEYAEKLTATLPDNLNCVYLVNSGSEANDLAIMMARLYTGNYDIISLRNSYHGKPWKS